ncbi:MAG: helix-turn-helix domain-containing protein [Myxococcota bacterium]
MDSLFGQGTPPERQQSAAAKVERAVEEAIAARSAGRPEEAVEKTEAALSWLDAGQVRRELRVAVPRELGLGHLLLGHASKAREALLLALEQAAHDPVLSDPVRAALATLELMAGMPERAKQMLEGRGRNRRATLSAIARIHLYEGQTAAAEAALQEADQAPGGTTASGILHPPATVLRCFASIWGRRPDQARMLYDGVASRDNPMWELVRIALLRALWAQSGDGRWLQLAIGQAEQLRFAEHPPAAPGFMPAVLAQHAACLALVGELALAVEAADQAMTALGVPGALSLPEWPRQAVLADCALVFRDANDRERWGKVLAQWDALAWAEWAERMALVSGARAFHATAADEEKPVQGDGGSLESLALRLLEDPRNPRLAALRSVGAAASALGVEWTDAAGEVLGRIGARATDVTAVETVKLGDGSVLSFYKAQRDAVRALDRSALDALARVVSLREEETRKLGQLHDLMTTAEAARRVAEERLEQVRRPGTDKGHGGRFPTVVGRSDRLRLVLDRLATLATTTLPVLLEGAPGSGRRHLAQALYLCGSDDPTGSSRAPMLDVALVPWGDQIAALERLSAKTDMAIVANAGELGPEAATWLAERLASPGTTRWVATLSDRATGAVADALRLAFTAGHVRVPGLDERLEDLPILIDQFLREAGRRPDDLSTAARAVLARRPWSGHVHEVRSVIRGAVVRAAGGAIQPEHVERHQASGAVATGEDPLLLGWSEALRAFQKDLLVRALEATAGHRGRAADMLGLGRDKLVRLAKEHDLDAVGDDDA